MAILRQWIYISLPKTHCNGMPCNKAHLSVRTKSLIPENQTHTN